MILDPSKANPAKYSEASVRIDVMKKVSHALDDGIISPRLLKHGGVNRERDTGNSEQISKAP